MCVCVLGGGAGRKVPEEKGGGGGERVPEMEDVPQRKICESALGGKGEYIFFNPHLRDKEGVRETHS